VTDGLRPIWSQGQIYATIRLRPGHITRTTLRRPRLRRRESGEDLDEICSPLEPAVSNVGGIQSPLCQFSIPKPSGQTVADIPPGRWGSPPRVVEWVRDSSRQIRFCTNSRKSPRFTSETAQCTMPAWFQWMML